jgi:uncharacterized protein
MDDFTPIASALGGVLIGLSASAMLLFHGRIAGISGIAGGLVRPSRGDTLWRVLFLAGLLAGGAVMAFVTPGLFQVGVDRSVLAVVVAGLLVGFGSRLGSGCTSGHGVCGITRLSPRSLVATGTFMLTGALMAFLVTQFFGGKL